MSKLATPPIVPVGSSPSITMEVTPQMMADAPSKSRPSRSSRSTWSSRKRSGSIRRPCKRLPRGSVFGYSTSPDALEVEFTGPADPEGP